MNIKLIILSIISVIFSLSTLSGQNQILKSGELYNLEGKEYSKVEIVTFLENQAISAVDIRRYKKEKSFSKGLLYTGAVIGGTSLLYAGAIVTGIIKLDKYDIITPLSIFYGASVTAIVVPLGLLLYLSSHRTFNRAKNAFNNKISSDIGYQNRPSLNLIVGNNGIGLALRF